MGSFVHYAPGGAHATDATMRPCRKVAGDSMTGSNLNNTRSDSAPKHAKHYRTSHTLRTAITCFVLAIIAFILCFAGSVYAQLNGKISSTSVGFIDQDSGSGDTKNDVLDPYDGQSITILILGQDTRDGAANAALGGGELANEHQADTTIVAQISADRSYINLVSIPRDSIVDRPSCKMSDGSTLAAEDGVMFNSIFATAYSQGGDLASAASCAVHSVNYLTGLNINQFVVVDFAGMSEMVNALGGVDICLPTDVDDAYSGLKLSAGVQHLDGTQATQYARTRHGLGDGSDLMRTTRQQYLIKRLIRTALQKNIISQSNQLYQFALSALNNLSLSSGLASASTLVGLASTLTNLDVNRIYSRTIPVTTSPDDQYRVVWDDSAADIWKLLRDGNPLQTDATSSDASSDTSSSSSDTSSAASGDASSSAEETSPDTSSEPSASDDSSSNSVDLSTMTTQQRIDYYTAQGGTYDATTQVITTADGTLIDPGTGGTVDPSDGTIRDPNTGYATGISYGYLTATFCPTLQ